MQVDLQTALAAFARLPDDRKSPYFHPYYVLADATRDRSLEPIFFVYAQGGETFYHAFHRGKVEGTGFGDIQSPYAYGGPLSSTRDPGFLAGAWQRYRSWCRDNRILAEFVRFHPLLENWCFFPGEIRKERETVWIDLRREDLFSSYSQRVRTAVRKARKNQLRVEWANSPLSYRTFADLYARSMALLGADPFYFYPPEYFQKLQEWDQAHLALCLKGEEILAAALFLRESHMMEYHLAAAGPEGKRLSAGNLLLDRGAVMAGRLGCSVLHLGGGTDNRPDNPLFFFKCGFAGERASFRIGRIIHAPEAYADLRREWQERYGEGSEKILFYRFPQKPVGD
jgi:hypothetical protein